MERNSGILFLISLFALGVLAAAGLAFLYARTNGELRRAQAEIPAIERHRALAQQLAADVIEYSKTHPAVNPILQPLMSPNTSSPQK